MSHQPASLWGLWEEPPGRAPLFILNMMSSIGRGWAWLWRSWKETEEIPKNGKSSQKWRLGYEVSM